MSEGLYLDGGGFACFSEKEVLMFLLLIDYCAAAVPELATSHRYVA